MLDSKFGMHRTAPTEARQRHGTAMTIILRVCATIQTFLARSGSGETESWATMGDDGNTLCKVVLANETVSIIPFHAFSEV